MDINNINLHPNSPMTLLDALPAIDKIMRDESAQDELEEMIQETLSDSGAYLSLDIDDFRIYICDGCIHNWRYLGG